MSLMMQVKEQTKPKIFTAGQEWRRARRTSNSRTNSRFRLPLEMMRDRDPDTGQVIIDLKTIIQPKRCLNQ